MNVQRLGEAVSNGETMGSVLYKSIDSRRVIPLAVSGAF